MKVALAGETALVRVEQAQRDGGLAILAPLLRNNLDLYWVQYIPAIVKAHVRRAPEQRVEEYCLNLWPKKHKELKMPPFPNAVSPVTEIAAADPKDALQHFERLLSFETDCWDVHAAITGGHSDFVLLDVRSPQAYAARHVPTAVNLPHGRINERNLAEFAPETLFVVYCAGPHCNGADRGAARLARLGRRVKKMVGGIEGWKDEGFDFATHEPGFRGIE